jgi:RimJ/RimL family protein N-acetyltransferase
MTSNQRFVRRITTAAIRARSLVRRPRVLRGARTERPFDAPIVRVGELTLRPHRLAPADVSAWYELQSNPDVIRYLPWELRTREQSLQHLRDRTRHTRLWQADDFIALAIEREGRMIGDVSAHLRTVAPADRVVEVGWLISPSESGHGYATRAAEALIDYVFEVVRASRVVAVIHPQNTRSRALARRLGFVRMVSGGDLTEFVLTAAQWRGRVARPEQRRLAS